MRVTAPVTISHESRAGSLWAEGCSPPGRLLCQPHRPVRAARRPVGRTEATGAAARRRTAFARTLGRPAALHLRIAPTTTPALIELESELRRRHDIVSLPSFATWALSGCRTRAARDPPSPRRTRSPVPDRAGPARADPAGRRRGSRVAGDDVGGPDRSRPGRDRDRWCRDRRSKPRCAGLRSRRSWTTTASLPRASGRATWRRGPRLGAQPGRISWGAELPPLAAVQVLRYRFVAGDERTRWFEVTRVCVAARRRRTSGRGRHRAVGRATRPRQRRVAHRTAAGLPAPVRAAAGAGRAVSSASASASTPSTSAAASSTARSSTSTRARGRAPIFRCRSRSSSEASFGFHVDTGRRVLVRRRPPQPRPDPASRSTWSPASRQPRSALRLFAGDPDRVLARVRSSETGRPQHSAGLDLPALDERQRVEHPGARVEEVAAQRARGHPRRRDRDRGLERRGDVRLLQRCASTRSHPDGSPHRLADFHFPADGRWPDPKGWSMNCTHAGSRCCSGRSRSSDVQPRPSGRRPRDDGRPGLLRRARADGKPYRNRGWWFPGALMPDFTNPEATDGGLRSAATSWRGRRRRLQDRRRRARVGHAISSTRTARHGGETNNRYPVLYATPITDLCARRARRRHVQPRGLHRLSRRPVPLGRRRGLHLGGFPASISAGLTAGACGIFFWGWDLAGFSGPVPTPSSTSARPRWRRCARSCSTTPSTTTTVALARPDAVERCGATGDAKVIPVFRRFVRLRERLVPYLAEQGERHSSAASR